MLEKNPSPNVDPTDLLLLQKHIQLGKNHLEKCLSQTEIDTLFHFIKLNRKTEKKLSTTLTEIAGYSSLVFNTILTSALGFWLGLSSLLKLKISTQPYLGIILIFSLFLGFLISFQSILFRKKNMEEATDKRKLKDLEIQIVKQINLYKGKELEEKIDELVSLLKDLKIKVKMEDLIDPNMDFQKLCLEWISHREDAAFIRKSLEEKIQLKAQYEEETVEFKKIAQKLSHFPVCSHLSFASWARAHLPLLIITLIPTLFGAIASLFVYINGVRTFYDEIGNKYWISFWERQDVKIIELIMVILITIYFAFSFIHMHRKGLKRDQEIAKIEAHLIREEKLLHFLNEQLAKIKECLLILSPLKKN